MLEKYNIFEMENGNCEDNDFNEDNITLNNDVRDGK